MIWDFINQELQKGYIINANQHGSMENRSHQTNLVFFDAIINLVDKCHRVDTMFLDACKVSDLVSNNILINKLK